MILDLGSNKLTVAIVIARLIPELNKLGFVRVKDRSVKLVKKLNDETELVLYPGVSRRGGGVRMDPLIGVENLILREMMRMNEKFRGQTRVCHAYLGIFDSWGHISVRTSDELSGAIETIAESVQRVGIPLMSAYDTLDKVRMLLRDHIACTKQVPVAVLFAQEKLRLIEPHYRDVSGGRRENCGQS
jgi:hypothetical protein